MNKMDKDDRSYLMENARVGCSLGLSDFSHLDSNVGILNYIRIANDISRQFSSGHILDWGCGFGQMAYLLQRRGLNVTPFSIGTPDKVDLPINKNLNIVYSLDRTNLPFENGSFGAVLSCGVLEHVEEGGGNEDRSLQEIYRLLSQCGKFFIYQLPQKYTWQEMICRCFKLGYTHPRRYTLKEIKIKLDKNGFQILRAKRFNLIPKNLTGMPRCIKHSYNQIGHYLIDLDKIICAIPLLNQFAGVLEITAVRRCDV